MKILIEPESSEDLKTVAQWWVDEWGHTNTSITADKILERLSSRLASDDDFLCVMTGYENGELVAAAELKYREHKDYPNYIHWVGGVFVKPSHRGKGYASDLINKAKLHTKSLNIAELFLQCEEHNSGLYVKLGFKPLHTAVHNGVDTTVFKFSTNT